MRDTGVWAGLSESAFLADVDDRDRDPWRFAATLMGGVLAGFVALAASAILVFVIYTLLTGHGSEGYAGIHHVDDVLRSSKPQDLKAALLNLVLPAATNGPFALAFVAVAALLARHAFLDYVTAARRVRWRLLVSGLALSMIIFGPLIAAQIIFSPGALAMPILTVSHDWAGRGVYLIAAIALLIPAAAAEELVFRGWLLRQTAALIRQPGTLIALTALIFSAIHFDFSPDAFLMRALMGAGFAYMTLRLGGIEFSTGVHASNNILIILFIEPLTLQPVSGPASLSAETLVVGTVTMLIYVLITEAVARIPFLRRWSGVAPQEISGLGVAAPHFG